MSHLLGDLRNELLAKNKIFTIGEANSIVNIICNGNEYVIDTLDRFHGPFFYEICPLLTIANKLGDEVSRIQFTGAQSGFDGLLFGRNKEKQKVEMTAAIDGYNDSLQMELLAKQGCAPAFQKIDAKGTKRNRQFGNNESNAFTADDYYQTLRPLFEEAIRRKTSKATTNADYRDAWLGIVFDNYILPKSDRNKTRLDHICSLMLDNSRRNYAPFSRVFFVGANRAYVFDSDIDMARESEE